MISLSTALGLAFCGIAGIAILMVYLSPDLFETERLRPAQKLAYCGLIGMLVCGAFGGVAIIMSGDLRYAALIVPPCFCLVGAIALQLKWERDRLG